MGGSLPILDTEDLNLFTRFNTGYIHSIFLGVKDSKGLKRTLERDLDYMRDFCPMQVYGYHWLDNFCYSWFHNLKLGFKPNANIFNAESELVKQLRFPVLDQPGRCIILLYMPQSMTFGIQKAACDVPIDVSLYCSFKENRTLVSSSLSTIHIRPIQNEFTAIEWGIACTMDTETIFWASYMHWFQQGDLCINVQKCIGDCNMCIEGRPAYKALEGHLRGVSPTISYKMVLSQKSVLGKFISVLTSRNVNSSNIEYIYIAFDAMKSFGLQLSNSSSSNGSVMLRVPVLKSITRGLWAVTGNVELLHTFQSAHYILCEREPMHRLQPQKCEHFSCNDGTCLMEKFLCDGKYHCVNGDDETNCGSMCSSYEFKHCLEQCSYEVNCRCSRGYFQCQSGGCITVGKLCDSVDDCSDKSDEPISCFIRSAELQWQAVQVQWNQTIQQCSLTNFNTSLLRNRFHIEPAFVPLGERTWFLTLCNGTGITSMACEDIRPLHAKCFPLKEMCVYSLVNQALTVGQNIIFPCSNGYHLAKCRHMHCQNTFKCPQSYCLLWEYVCDGRCDCRYCEDESICDNVTCPGFLLQSSLQHKLICRKNNDHATELQSELQLELQFSALIMHSSIYDIYKYIQSKLQKFIWVESKLSTSNPIIKGLATNVVYLDVRDGNHLSDHPRINAYLMQFIIFCNITRYIIELEDAHLLENLTVVKYLDLSHNSLRNNISFIFLRITQLVFLDLSSNLISHFSRSFICMSPDIKYLFLHNNTFTSLEPKIFHSLDLLRVVFLQNNQLFASVMADVLLFPPGSTLSMLWSDIPRMCCMVSTDKECMPSFPFSALTCDNMIQSVLHVTVSWIVGVLTSFCNLIAVLIFIVILIKPNMLSEKQRFSVYLSFHIILSDFIVSLCLLSLCFHNIRLHDVFGIYADQWRGSIHCLILELLMFVFTECSLLFSVYLVIHSYFSITSMVQTRPHHSRSLMLIVAVWVGVILLGICKQILWNIYNGDDYNYYCLSFQVTKPKHLTVTVFLTCIIIGNATLIAIYMAFQLLLFKYIRNHVKQTSKCFKSTIQGWRISLKLSLLVISNVITWTPILISQLLIIFGPDINPSTLYLILLVSLPSNLLIIPFTMVIPFLRSQSISQAS